VHPRDIVRLSLLASLGGLLLAVAVWMITFGFGDTQQGGGSFIGILVLLAGLVVLLGALFLLGGAGIDAVWAKLEAWREARK